MSDQPVFLYVCAGAALHRYGVDPARLTLTWQASTQMPEAVQYVWRHPSLPLLYVAYSNRNTVKGGQNHGVAVYAMHCGTGDLAPLAPAVQLANRPVHVSLDPAGRFLLAACNMPSEVMVYRLAADGRVGELVQQSAALDTGIFAHQVLAAPSGRFAVLPTRGNDATEQAAEEPGALKVFHFHDGQLSNAASFASNDGFGPRHAEFHPSLPVIYVVTERGNQLLTYAVTADGISAAPLASSDTVRKPGGRQPVQFAGALRVHPNGRSLYVLNRSDATAEFAGRHVHSEGENTVAVFAIDPASGIPSLIQTAETGTFHCRTMSIHPDGGMLVTLAVAPLAVRDGDQVRDVPAGLSVFGVAGDGRLSLARTYDIDAAGAALMWCGMIATSL